MVQTRHHRLDYEVLWGVITHRLGYASAREIEAAFRRCTADRCQSLGEILVEEGVITPETRERIEELAFTALRNHQGNTVEILRSLGGRATLEHCFGGSVCFRGKHELALIFATEGGDGTTVAERPTEEGSITTVVERPAEEGSITTVVERPTEGGNRTTAVERPTEGGKSLAATQEPPLADPRLEETASIHIEGSSAQEGRKHPSSRPNTSPSSGVPLRTPSPSPGSWRHRFGETQPLALDASSGASSAPNDTRVSDFDERYVITDPIGKGGMGLVYEGKDLELNRKLAIKVMRQEYRTSPKLVAKFIKEAQIQGQLEHPNICPVHELGVNAQGHLYFTMKRVKGQSLQQMLDDLRRKGDRGESLFSLLEIFKKICDGVAFAHARGVIHRDLKPNNIMIGEFGEVLVMDWGLARLRSDFIDDARNEEDGLAAFRKDHSDPAETTQGSEISASPGLRALPETQEGVIVGTLHFMPPEQAQGAHREVDERSDIYALGGILYAMLTLEAPIQGRTKEEILRKIYHHEIVPPSRRTPQRPIPFDLEEVTMKAMAFRKEERYASVLELKAEISRFLEGLPVEVADYNPFQLLAKWARRNRVLVASALALFLILSIFSVVYVINVTKARDEAERRLAESLVLQGDALVYAGRHTAAIDRYREARRRFQEVGASPFIVDLGLWEVFQRFPLPLNDLIGHTEWVNAIGFSPDGTRAISAGNDKAVILWEVATGRKIRIFDGHRDTVACVAFSPDGSLAVSGGFDRMLHLWEVETGRIVQDFVGHEGWVRSVAFCPDGKFLLSGGNDRIVRLWNVTTGRESARFEGHENYVTQVACSPDGKQILAASYDGTILIWNREDGRRLQRLQIGSDYELKNIAFSPDGRHVVSGTAEASMKLWDLATGQEIRTFTGRGKRVCTARFSPEGNRLLTGNYDGTVDLWETETGRLIRTYQGHRDAVCTLAFSPQDDLFLSGSYDRHIKLWSLLPPPGLRAVQAHEGTITSTALSPDGRLGLSGGSDGRVRLWDMATTRLLRTWWGGELPVEAVAFSPDGQRIAAGGGDREIRIWDPATGREETRLSGHEGDILSLAFSPDGKRLLSGGKDHLLKLWDPATGQEIRTFSGHTHWVDAVAFSPSGTRIASGSHDKTVRIWDVEGGLLHTLIGHERAVRTVTFSADGTRLFSGGQDHTIRVWDVETGREIRKITGHSEWVRQVLFAPLPLISLLISAGNDATIRFWDAQSGREWRNLTEGKGAVTALAFDAVRRRMLSGGEDGMLHFWDFSPTQNDRETQIETLVQRLQKNANDAEALVELAGWYALHAAWPQALSTLRHSAEIGNDSLPSLLLARAAWFSGDLPAAREAFLDARARGEAPARYLDLCLQALTKREEER